MKTEIAAWLVEEVNKRGWSFRELGRRAGLSHSTVSRVVTGETLPGWEFCRRVARALNMPAEHVFRRAGLLPVEPEETSLLKEMTYLFHQLSSDDQQRLVVFVRAFIEGRKELVGRARSDKGGGRMKQTDV